MAMQDPSSLMDSLMRFLGGPQPAFAGIPSFSGAVAMGAAAPGAAYSGGAGPVTNINVTSSVTTAVPEGTPAEQKKALESHARQAVRSEWEKVIQGARGMIPSPEVRRTM
jgi:hypothetical protein